MAKPNSPNKPYTKRETDYIRRVAGKVPVALIAETLNRTPSAIKQWASANGVHLRVPHKIMVKHWREYVSQHQTAM
ncbi:hypothetical protein [Atlantibacter hermannii]|uniref:hypothetical protein n=1 Tax=Atlantibacter hermannii TaxID=565 RepID=UPI002801982C|nr:hypothetical protein [Atlantibacter hermannii]MDQ7883702.1 hypothetical protein [Atlantibacter hermannii]